MIVIHETGRPIDLEILTDQLHGVGKLEASGGLSYLSKLMEGVPRVSNVNWYARIVKQKSVRRRLIYAAQKIQQDAFDGAIEPAEMCETAISYLRLLDQKATSDLSLWQNIPNIATLSHQSVEFVIPGLFPLGSVILITGLPGTHKTNFEMAAGWVISEGTKLIGRDCRKSCVLVLDRENPQAVIQQRMLR
jgi:hypothetical protein